MTEEFIDGEVVDDPNLPALAVNELTLSQQTQEIAVLVDLAHKYPRSVKRFMADAVAMATINQAVAEDFSYNAPVGKKQVGGIWKESYATGPSIRAAEIVASAWGNIQSGWRIVAIKPDVVEVEGFCIDLQTMAWYRTQVVESIIGKSFDGKPGKRYSDRQINRVVLASGSKARRNAIFGVVPRAYVDEIAKRANDCALGKSKGLDLRRAEVIERMIAVCREKGKSITEQQVCSIVGKMDPLDLNWDDINDLIGSGTGLRDGVIAIDDLFPAETGSKPDSWKDSNPPPKSRKQREREALDAPPERVTMPEAKKAEPERVESAAVPPAPKAARAPETQAPYAGPTDDRVEKIFKILWKEAVHGDGTAMFTEEHFKKIIRSCDGDVEQIRQVIAEHRQDQP